MFSISFPIPKFFFPISGIWFHTRLVYICNIHIDVACNCAHSCLDNLCARYRPG